jgi:hypothetical protein
MDASTEYELAAVLKSFGNLGKMVDPLNRDT